MIFKISATAAGAALGLVVALVAHFISHTVPSTFYVGSYQSADSTAATVTDAGPYVHPGWLPVLPIAIAVGAAVGLVLGVLVPIAGWKLVRVGRTESA